MKRFYLKDLSQESILAPIEEDNAQNLLERKCAKFFTTDIVVNGKRLKVTVILFRENVYVYDIFNNLILT